MRLPRSLTLGLVLLTYGLLAQMASAQPPKSFGTAARISQGKVCGGYQVFGFGAAKIINNAQAKETLEAVMRAANMKLDTIQIVAADVANAYACENDEGQGRFRRYILYSPQWLNQLINETGSDWTARAIFAHEVGHHKKGHNLRDLICSARLEAEADEVAGETLARLGATLEQAQVPFRTIGEDKGDECYPSRDERMAAVRRGWEGKEEERENTAVGTATLELTTSQNQKVQSGKVCSSSKDTPELDNVRCRAGCECPGDGKWCHHNVAFEVRAQGANSQIHSPRFECVRDNVGSCEWNAVGDSSRDQILQNDGKVIQVQRLFSSRSIGVRLCVTEDRYANVPVKSNAGTWSLARGYLFVAEVPNGASGILKIHWKQNQDEIVTVGESTAQLKLVRVADTPTAKLYTYEVIP